MKTIILGGGIAGLTVGHQLKKAKKEVIVFEKEDKVGGLSRTINLNGNRFDFGGHRFWTKNDELNQFLKDLLKDELLEVPRTSKIHFNRKYVDYPLKFTALFSLGFSRMILTGVDFIYGRFLYHLKKDIPDRSFEDYIIRNFGYQLYKYFFKDYTEKIWGIPCTRLSGEWARQRIKGLSMRSILKGMIKKDSKVATLVNQFYYPKLGIARIPEKLAENLNIKHEEVRHISTQGNKILSVNGERADLFISSIPITELALLFEPPERVRRAVKYLKYRDITFVFLVFEGDTLTPESWIYFPDPNVPFGRIHEPKNWSKYMCKEGQSSIVVEFFSNVGDEIWTSDDKDLINKAIENLKDVDLWNGQKIIDTKVLRIEKCYPMYEMGYQKHLNIIKNFLLQFENLRLIGRNGTFKYLNIDHVLEMGIKCADNIIKDKWECLDYIGSEEEYQEEKK